MTQHPKNRCPGCGLEMPVSEGAVNPTYFNATPECWMLYTEVLGTEFANAVIFGQAHQLTVDAYAVQHAGGEHPDKSIDIHLSGLYLVLEEGRPPTDVPRLLQRLAGTVETWPHFPPPDDRGALTVLDVGLAPTAEAHVDTVRRWASAVWTAWSPHHAAAASLVSRHLGVD